MPETTHTIRVQLNYPQNQIREPIVYRLVSEFGLVPNIRRANIDIQTGGFIVLELTGDDAQIGRGLKFLEDLGITVTNIGVEGTQEWNA